MNTKVVISLAGLNQKFREIRNRFFFYVFLRRILANFILKFKVRGLKIGYGSAVVKSSLDENVVIHEGCKILNSTIGKFSYISERSVVSNSTIGCFCSIASNARIGVGKHPTDRMSSHPVFYNKLGRSDNNFYEEYERVVIGSDVWIGVNVIVLDGVNIGHGAVIGAGAVVTKDVPNYAISVGVPAKVKDYRFSSDKIDWLISSEWWDKSLSEIRAINNNFKKLDY
ncbi:hypothetical protein N9Q87_00710 [Porticoccaceae bacterium]|nr:hypothetical protein [Porticoccaceae bacterium]